jgi:hypothetical protein
MRPDIIRAIFSNDIRTPIVDYIKLVDHIETQFKDNEQIDLEQESPVASVTVLNYLRRAYIFMYEHEADGYPSVSILCTCIVQELTARYPEEFFTCTNQFAVAKNNKPGQNLATDAVKIHKKGIDSPECIPIIIVEYKPRLNPLLTLVEPACLLFKYIIL